MSTTIEMYQGNSRVAKTNKAFSVTTKKELMRAYTSEFTVPYNDPIAVYIEEDSVYKIDGQLYDSLGINEESGNNNATTVQSTHVGFRLNNYKLPIGYSFVGTVAQIAQDILNVSGASAEFTVGTCANVSGSFSLGNTQETSARAGLFALKVLSVEVDFDNFILNFPVRCGTGDTLVLETGKNLINVKHTYQKDNGNTYEVEFANTYRIDGSNPFAVGDDCTVIDHIRNRTFTKRIITYAKCIDDPSKDKITLGVFVRDSEELNHGMNMDISAAQETADNAQTAAENSLQPGTSYNNVSIDHEHGFMSVSADGLSRTFDNGTDGYIRQQYYNGAWVTVYEANKGADGAGMVTVYNLTRTQKVVMGGSVGYAVYKWDSTTSAWVITGGMGVDGANGASKLFNPEHPETYAVIGEINNAGNLYRSLVLHNQIDGVDSQVLQIYNLIDMMTRIKGLNDDLDITFNYALNQMNVRCKNTYLDVGETSAGFAINGSSKFSVDSNGPHCSNATGDIPLKKSDGSNVTVHVKYGAITGWS